MKKEAARVLTNVHYYASKMDVPEFTMFYKDGPRTDYSIRLEIQQNLDKKKMVNWFAYTSQFIDAEEEKWAVKKIYNRPELEVNSFRKNGITRLYSALNDDICQIITRPNEAGRFGISVIDINYNPNHSKESNGESDIERLIGTRLEDV
jgi:hypothetical protein